MFLSVCYKILISIYNTLKTKIRALWRYIMFRITYGYYRIDENFEPIGDAIVKYVDGETVKQVNDAFHFIGYNHDLSKYTPTKFWKVEEIGEH